MPVTAVFFDIGETLVDETGLWSRWAEWLGVSTLTFFGVLGAVIERSEHHRRVFEILRPGIDIEAEQRKREAAGDTVGFLPEEFYSDAASSLAGLRAAGYLVGVAGNTGAGVEALFREHLSPLDFISSSHTLGAEKPTPAFFQRIAELAGRPTAEIAYVGDRVDNDVLPAVNAGMVAVHIRRGPWGYLHALRPEAAEAHLRIDSLGELSDALSTTGQ